MSAGAVSFHMSGKAKRMQKFPAFIAGETKNAIRRGQARWRSALIEEFRSVGIGRAIFGGANTKNGLKTVIARESVRKAGADGNYNVGIRLKGIAAMVARGGAKTADHRIGADKKLLLGTSKGGLFAAVGVVKHPGGQLKRDRFQDRALPRVQAEFSIELARGLDAAKAFVESGSGA